MRALAVDAQGKLSVPEISVPKYNDAQALVKTLSCGVCNGTDTKLIHGNFKNMEDYPMLLGHEGVGRVVEVGKSVTKYQVGDIVLLPFLYEPQDGFYQGWGAYAEYAVVGDQDAFARFGKGIGTPEYDEGCWGQTIIRPDDKVDAVGAAMIITFREVLSAIRRFGFKANENILIFGAGPVGSCFTKFTKLLGLNPVITVDINDEKCAEAKKMGADIVINSTTQNVEEEVKKLFPNGMDNIVDAVGINALLNQGLRLVKYNGKVCGYGISPKTGMELDWSKAPYNWNLNFVQFPSKYEEYLAHSQIMAWINSGILDPMDFISDVFDFDNILDAFALLDARKNGTKKIVIRYPE
ncbi:MAG: zinc-binding dehydrogenase [Lachnospiraceae bacterium]|jgi:L-iditol 2-dehydrogenase/propanol-preferring alcohol dehydrogenase|nr:zinc-binding dehydrogenase [Lachnospiraceae bacterium]